MIPDAEIVSAFTEEQAAKLAGLTVHQLRHWDRTDVFRPSLSAGEIGAPYEHLYSFRDLLSLQVLETLRAEAGLSLPQLREVKHDLADLGDNSWSRTRLQVLNKTVVFRNEEEAQLHEVSVGQIVLDISLKAVRTKLQRAIKDFNKRGVAEIGHIEKKRDVRRNRAVIAGTRIRVDSIERLKEDGFTVEQILQEYPSLTEADVEAALRYTAEQHAA